MKFLLVTALLAVAVTAQPTLNTARVEENVCLNLPNGQTVATGTCNSYVLCQDNFPYTQVCDQGKLFNATVGMCDLAQNVNCEEFVGTPQGPAPSCEGRTGQMLRNPYDCSSFYHCEHNAALLMHCDEGLYFDSAIGNCNWKANVVCRVDQWTVDPNAPDCYGRDWTYVPNYVNCGTYYRCENDQAVLYSCPEALLFDPNLLTCNWAPSVRCYN